MKNIIGLTLTLTVLVFAVIGCSSINPLAGKDKKTASPTPSNKSLTDKTVDDVVGDEKIGIPECDEVMDMMTAEANNPDDGYIVKAGKAMFFNSIKQKIKQSIEENKNDKTEVAKQCREFKVQLDKYKAEEEKNKK